MTALLENPVPLVVFGIAVEAGLFVAFLRTGRGLFLGIMGLVLLAILAAVGLERLVVTETERVEAAIEGLGAALEANDEKAVLGHLWEDAKHSRSEARRALKWVTFTRIKINDLEIKLDDEARPPTARARFAVTISATGKFGAATRLIYFNLDLLKQGDRWLVADHELENAPGGF